MFGLRRRLEAWRGRPSQPKDPSTIQSAAQLTDHASPALTGLSGAPVTGALRTAFMQQAAEAQAQLAAAALVSQASAQ